MSTPAPRERAGARVEGTALRPAWTEVHGLPEPLAEPARGYRFRPENRVITDLAPRVGHPVARVVDLGAGCGVLGLLAGAACGVAEVVLVERDPDLAAFCRYNADRSPVPAHVVEDDLRAVGRGVAPADLVVANPPFFAPGEGQPSSSEMVRNATHAAFGDVHDFARAASGLLTAGGTLLLLYPADRLADALGAVVGSGLAPTRLLVLRARHTGRPYRVWIAARHAAARLELVEATTWTER